ncbi:hypothetical protein CHUAL_007367 [Chamberlinius hualienensis]
MKTFFTNRYISNIKNKLKPTFNFDCDSSDIRKKGILTLPEAWEKDCSRQLASEHVIDSLGFCGVRRDDCVLLTRITRKNNRLAEVILYLRLSDGVQYQLPHHPHVCVYNTDGRSFSAAGLNFEVIEPLRIWRIFFNGYLRKGVRATWDESESDVVEVRFNFIWHPIHGYMGFPEDFSVPSMVKLFAKQKTEPPSPYDLFTEDWQEQFGQLHGVITINNQNTELLLRGLKARKHGIPQGDQLTFSFQGVLHNGTTFHLFAECDNVLQNFVYGYLCTADSMKILPVNDYHIDFEMLMKNPEKFPDNSVINFIADGVKYTLKVERVSGMTVYSGQQWNRMVNIFSVKVNLNASEGEGIVEISVPNENQTHCPVTIQDSVPQLLDLTHITQCNEIVVDFSEENCKSSQIVGGKGSSLALMSSLDSQLKNFSIPDGFCLTKTAFDLHLKHNSHLNNAIAQLKYTAGHNHESLKDECDNMYAAVIATVLSEILKTTIVTKLEDLFGENYGTKRFAIRSSAVGEDGEELSAAGQNDTYLGVKGTENIFLAVVKCWASQFAYRSIEYKRQNGQPLYAGMGVVIQEMVNAEIAGVLFSRDPITGSSAKMVITSNFGLGESVVSASAEPDYIILRRTWNDKLHTTDDNVIGSKKNMITMNEDGDTKEIELDADQCSKLTVDNELASRPITGNNNLTDFEIMHEFDTVLRVDEESFSTANVGEVMPGSTTPVTFTSVSRAQVPFVQKMISWRVSCHRYDPTITEMFGIFYGHVMQETVMMKAWNLEKKKSAMTKAMEVGIYGRVLDDDDVTKIAIERFTNPPFRSKIYLMNMSLKGIISRKSLISDAVQRYQNYTDPSLSGQTAEETFNLIGQHLVDVEQAMIAHMSITMSSTVWNFLILNILSRGDGDFGLDQYSDFAYLVGSSNGAESGNVPFSLQELANAVSKEMDPSQFIALDPTEALKWLQNGDGEVSKKYNDFIERHGHRGLKEFDMSCVSWAMDPTQIVTVVKNMLKAPTLSVDKKDETLDDVISGIKTPLGPIQRRLLRWVLGKCRRGVCNRELTKSIVIKVYHGLRLGYRRLGKLMSEEGLIPDANLILFLTFDEIDRILKTRSPLLIQRAKQRMRLHPFMDRLRFEEMIKGIPVPIDENAQLPLSDGAVEIKGYPVSQGTIEGRARVITTFHDVHTIQPGEILIAHATDIGWSPYFPMLGGVVTELGGLISHGAVVAREFGLPCVVGAQNATRVFQTGDKVLLDASKGTITRISKCEDNEH